MHEWLVEDYDFRSVNLGHLLPWRLPRLLDLTVALLVRVGQRGVRLASLVLLATNARFAIVFLVLRLSLH